MVVTQPFVSEKINNGITHLTFKTITIQQLYTIQSKNTLIYFQKKVFLTISKTNLCD